MEEKSVRNSNIEILRIISMVFIVLSHYSVHNGINNYDLPFGLNRFLLTIFVLGNIGVIIYVLISGYFLIDSDNFSLKKLLKIILQVGFYSITIYSAFCAFGLVKFSIKELIKNLFPVVFKQYWFVTAYIVLYIFHPFINKLLKALTKKQWQLFVLVSLTLFSIFPTFIRGGGRFL